MPNETKETAELRIESDTAEVRKLTLAQNALLTIQILAGFGLLGVAIWGINLWTAR